MLHIFSLFFKDGREDLVKTVDSLLTSKVTNHNLRNKNLKNMGGNDLSVILKGSFCLLNLCSVCRQISIEFFGFFL